MRKLFEDEECSYRALVAKCERLGREPAVPGTLELPVFPQPPSPLAHPLRTVRAQEKALRER